MWVAFFSAKNIKILYIESAKTVNEMTLNKLVKLMMLWATGPSTFSWKEKHPIWSYAVISLINPCTAEYIKMPRPLLIFSQSDYFIQIFSSPEHEVLMVSYCGQSMSGVRRQQLL